MVCPPTPQLCLHILLGSKTYLKEHPPNNSEDVVNQVYTLQGANYTAAQWFTLVQGA